MKGMKTKWMLILLLSTCATGGLWAQTLRVDYLDGTVEVQLSSGKWKALEEGAKVSAVDFVRLSDNGIAELTDGTIQLHLGRDGVYSLASLLSDAKKRPGQNLNTIVGDKLAKLVGAPGTSHVQVAQGGVRGAAQGSEELQWATEDEEVAPAGAPSLPEQVKALLAQQNYQAALRVLSDALASGKDDRLSLLLLKARVLAAQGRSAAALKVLSDAGFKRGQPGYMEATLLVGSQGIEAGEYDLVLVKTSEALEILPETEIVQSLLLAQALAYQGKGDLSLAQDRLKKVVGLDGTTPAGQEAQRILATL